MLSCTSKDIVILVSEEVYQLLVSAADKTQAFSQQIRSVKNMVVSLKLIPDHIIFDKSVIFGKLGKSRSAPQDSSP